MAESVEIEEDNDRVLVRLKRSRKAFLVEYTCGFLLLFFPLVGYLQGGVLPSPLRNLMLLLGVFSIGSAEITRLLIRYKITPAKIELVKGFIKQSKKNVYFHSLAFIPDINIHQSRMQRLLNYGNIHVYGGGNMSERVEIEDINNPKKVLLHIEKLINDTRKK